MDLVPDQVEELLKLNKWALLTVATVATCGVALVAYLVYKYTR